MKPGFSSPGARALMLGLMLLAGGLLAGCKQPLYTKLSEADANEMLVKLLEARIDVDKSSPDGKTWTLSAEKDDIARALSVLQANGLPGERRASLGEVFKKEGLISTPTEERVRFIFGVSQELSTTLSKIDGVVAARVHIVVPNNDPLAEKVTPSSASVFIKHLPTIDVSSLTPLVKGLVVRGVEGLSYEKVNVMLAAAAPANAATPALGARTTIDTGWVIALAAMLGLVTLVAAAATAALFKPGWLPAWVRQRWAPGSGEGAARREKAAKSGGEP